MPQNNSLPQDLFNSEDVKDFPTLSVVGGESGRLAGSGPPIALLAGATDFHNSEDLKSSFPTLPSEWLVMSLAWQWPTLSKIGFPTLLVSHFFQLCWFQCGW